MLFSLAKLKVTHVAVVEHWLSKDGQDLISYTEGRRETITCYALENYSSYTGKLSSGDAASACEEVIFLEHV